MEDKFYVEVDDSKLFYGRVVAAPNAFEANKLYNELLAKGHSVNLYKCTCIKTSNSEPPKSS